MTTIVADARAGIMAADSDWTDGDACGVTRKVFRIRGALVGFAGTLRDIETVRAWFRSGFKGEPPDTDVSALILRRSGISVWNSVNGELPEGHHQFAIGTGAMCARGAMAAGATCAQAVRIAIRIDANSSGRVRVYKLGN